MSLRVPPRWPVLVAAAFCLYCLLLLWNAVQSQQHLRVAADARLVAENQRRAAALGEFGARRLKATVELASLHEMQTYLVNKALGMSPRYGLDSSLDALEMRLRARQQATDGVGGVELRRIAFIDAGGQVLADTAPGGPALPVATDTVPGLRLDSSRGLIVASAPVVFKGELAGTLVTLGELGALYRSLISLEALGSYRETLLTTAGQEILPPAAAAAGAAVTALTPAQVSRLLALPVDRPTALDSAATVGDPIGGDDSMAVVSPVPGLPVLLVTKLSRSEIYGQLSSPWYLASLGVFPLLLLLAAVRMGQLQQRTHALQLDAARHDANRQVLQQRNEGLALEIQRRQALQTQMQRHRDQLEELVRRRTDELNRLFHALPDLYFRTTRDGTVLEHRGGRDADLIVGTAPLLGRRLQDVLPAEAAAPLARALAEVARGADPGVVEVGLPLPASQRHCEARLLPLGADECVIVVRDVTERHENDALREANRLEAERLVRVKSEFLANMSHEIRTPLNAVLGLAQLGAREHAAAKAGHAFQRIEDAGRHLLGIVDDILDLSKLEAGKLGIERRPFSLAGVVDGAVALVAGRTAAKGLHLRVSLAAGLPDWVQGDAMRLKQVLVNLLSNAVKFTAQGEVRLGVSAEDGLLCFVVADTGIGMDAAQRARLFQPFEQADSSITRRFGGTGLGLAISSNLAGLMDGHISVSSEPGQGSSFTLRLPLPAVPAPEAASAPLPVPARRLAGMRLLAAEDVDVNRLVLQGQLMHEGAEVVFADNGEEAVAAVAAVASRAGGTGFDAVLMDVQMPVMDGLEATRRIRRLAPGLPVIGLTAHALADERERCLDAGMLACVVKPADLDLLVAALLRHAVPAAAARNVTESEPA